MEVICESCAAKLNIPDEKIQDQVEDRLQSARTSLS
jgi:hypothetical protein